VDVPQYDVQAGRERIRDEDIPCSVNADLLVAAVESAIMAGNVDAARELISTPLIFGQVGQELRY
jgi:hypothetical protein